MLHIQAALASSLLVAASIDLGWPALPRTPPSLSTAAFHQHEHDVEHSHDGDIIPTPHSTHYTNAAAATAPDDDEDEDKSVKVQRATLWQLYKEMANLLTHRNVLLLFLSYSISAAAGGAFCGSITLILDKFGTSEVHHTLSFIHLIPFDANGIDDMMI
jgi:hypothetical protein